MAQEGGGLIGKSFRANLVLRTRQELPCIFRRYFLLADTKCLLQ
jgi:hypothetical protein